jgi:NAD(P)H-nitrite reductase large subunit
MKYAIIGTGAAGVMAAEAIRSVDAAGEITLLGDDPNGFYSRPGLAYYLTGEVDQKQLFPYPAEAWKQLNVRFLRGRVTKIFPNEHELSIEVDAVKRATQTLAYDRVLIASGSTAVKLQAPGAQLEGVVKLDHLDDAKRMLSLIRKTRTAVVVGGGITALELVEGLASRRVKVHYFLRDSRYWGNVLDEAESRIVEHRLKEEGVQIHFNTELAEIIGNGKKVTGVKTADGKHIRCEMLAYAIGIKPRIDLAKDAGIACDRGILADQCLQTNLPDIFAAGDAAQVFDPASGRSILDSLWSPAREQGYAAGLNMAGRRTVYVKKVPFNVTRLAGLTTTIIGTVGQGHNSDVVGIARGDSETWRQIPDAIVAQGGFDVNHLRLMVGEKTIVGAILMGDQKLSQPLEKIILGGADITPIRSQLLAPNAPIANIVAEFWLHWRGQYAA